LKITQVEAIHVALPYEHGAPKPTRSGIGAWNTQDILFLRVETDAGLVGWGEAFGHAATPVTIVAIREVIAPLAVGADPSDIAGTMSALIRRTQSMARSGPVQFALSGLDIALWDIAGQIAGQPIWQMLGGHARASVPAYASLFRLNTPDHVERVAANAAARGYSHIKLHEHTVENVHAARRGAGPKIPLMVDTNCHWDEPEDIIAFCEAVEDLSVAWLEEPLYPADAYEVTAAIRQHVKIPLAAGENLGNYNDARWLAAAGAVDIVQPSVAKIGGITQAWKTIRFLQEQNLRVVPHSPFVGPALIAAIHMIAAMPGEELCEHRFCDLGANPLGDAVIAVEGRLPVPRAPGLGITVDPSVVEKYRIG
jgi:L-alanine-DL-glutamate epimerase-like enolase superfamily enzyme